jgi:hypothetical protein
MKSHIKPLLICRFAPDSLARSVGAGAKAKTERKCLKYGTHKNNYLYANRVLDLS